MTKDRHENRPFRLRFTREAIEHHIEDGLSPRDAARLLVVRPGGAQELEDRSISDLPDLLRPGDCLVVNDSKVIAARLHGRRIGRGTTEPAIEATLHKRMDGSHWRAFVKPAKKLIKVREET